MSSSYIHISKACAFLLSSSAAVYCKTTTFDSHRYSNWWQVHPYPMTCRIETSIQFTEKNSQAHPQSYVYCTHRSVGIQMLIPDTEFKGRFPQLKIISCKENKQKCIFHTAYDVPSEKNGCRLIQSHIITRLLKSVITYQQCWLLTISH